MPSREEQLQESSAREAERRTAEIETTPDEPDTEITSTPPETPRAELAEPPVEEPAPRPMLLKDTKREEIVARFKTQRQQEEVDGEDDAAQIRRFANQGLPPELAPEEAETAPPTRRVVIRGVAMELTDDELVAAAQRGLAGDSYLDESKRKLREVDELIRQRRSESEYPAQDDAQDPYAGDAEQPSDAYTQLGESIQFGEPSEVGKALSETMASTATEAVQKEMAAHRLKSEQIQTQRILTDFQSRNADLANDVFASAAIRERLIQMQQEDLKALLGDETKLPGNSDELMNWHMHYRSEGSNVRDVPTLLKTAKEEFLRWRGGNGHVTPSTSSPEEPAPRPVAPKIVISSERGLRREFAQQSPSRTAVAPKPDSARAAPERDRSQIVQEMAAKRQAPKRMGIVK